MRLVTIRPFAALTLGGTLAGAAAEVDFNRDIKPILSENCYFCHGPDAADRKADLRLDTFEGATAERDGVRAIVPGKPDESELIHRIFSGDRDEVMPPPEAKISLSAEQKKLLREWVAAGSEYRQHWAFLPPTKPELAAGGHPIDKLVQRTLGGRQLAPEADRRTLLRRVTLDLTGLPPTPEEVGAFLADKSPDAYGKVVDRLLASPAYGERMAWDWLDAARYADTNGYQGDNERTMWPWRDWVVEAFNKNLPFDQFTLWQVAGDLLPGATFEQKLATGFMRNHPINGEGGRIPEENRVDYVFDMTETTGTVWLGLTLNCCRCHDHKFDPLSQREYFRLSAYFNQTPVNGGGGNAQTPPVLAVPSAAERSKAGELDKRVAEIDSQITKRRAELERGAASEKPVDPWRPLVADKVEAKVQKLTVQPDRSILASGDNPKNDTYTVRAPTDLGRVAAVRLEALMHPSMTGGGLARSNSGNFVLTGFEISLQRPGGGEAIPLKIASAQATYEQGGLKIGKAYNGNPGDGWAVHEGRIVDREHAAMFRFEKPVEAGEGSVLTFVLRHDSPHASHNLGRFRLSVSADPAAPLAPAGDGEDALIAKLTAERKGLLDQRNKLAASGPKVMVMEDMSKPRPTYILDKGLYTARGEEVPMGTPAILPPLPEGAPENRLGLARWLVADENPLTARVAVNRFWQQLFGIGLVKTSEDFGTQGETPENGELLDYLAVGFREGGWDVKWLMRHIVTSRTYCQTSRSGGYADDPENRALARGARFRMPSWMLRDQALAASGLLVAKVGGAPVNTYQPEGIWEEASFGKKRYRRGSGEDLYRRSLYTFWRRIIAPPAFFDSADRQTCSVKPFRTNTPLHALYLFNDVTFVEAARALAQLALTEAPAEDDRARLDFVLGRLLARPAGEAEAKTFLEALGKSRLHYNAQPALAEELLKAGDSPRDGSIDAAEHAAWTALCLAAFNLDEAVTKE